MMFIRRRAGLVHRLNQENKAYAGSTRESKRRYSEIRKFGQTEARTTTKREGGPTSPLKADDSAHNAYVRDAGISPLPNMED